MTPYFNEFLQILTQEDKPACVNYILSKLEGKEIDIPTLYQDVIAPALNSIECHNDEMHLCIWKEHVRSAIVRTIIECCYPYVLKQQSLSKHKLQLNQQFENNDQMKSSDVVVVLCPDGESHELGARMVADFFTILGFNTIFVGSSTPKQEFLQVISHVNPKYIAISVTNFYNLIAAKRTIQSIKDKVGVGDKIKILVGGNVFNSHPEQVQIIGADILIRSFDDIRALAEGGF